MSHTTSPTSTHRHITVLTNPTGEPVGKSYGWFDSQLLKETHVAVPLWNYEVVAIGSLEDLARVIDMLEPHEALILDRVKGAPRGQLFSAREWQKLPDVEKGRDDRQPLTKSTFTNDGVLVLDRDDDEGSYDEWWEKLCQVHPPLRDVRRLISPSSSGRVILPDGSRAGSSNFHTYILTDHPGKLEPAGKVFEARLWLAGHGRTAPGKSGQPLRRSILDVCTFSVSRRVFEADPVVEPPLKLEKRHWRLEGPEDGIWDLGEMPELTAKEKGRYEELTGRKMATGRADGYVFRVIARDLDPEMVVETAEGVMTVAEYRESDLGHIRCQTPFRPDSESWAAFLSRHEGANGEVFLYDVGDQTKHVLADRVVLGTEEEEKREPEPAPPATETVVLGNNVVAMPAPATKSELYTRLQERIARMPAGHTLEFFDQLDQIAAQAVTLSPVMQDSLISQLSAPPHSVAKATLRKVFDAARRELVQAGADVDDQGLWPVVNSNGKPSDHVDNIIEMCNRNGVTIRFNVMRQQMEYEGLGELPAGAKHKLALHRMIDLAVVHGLPTLRIAQHMEAIAQGNPYHPVGEWLNSLPPVNDDQDHIGMLAATLVPPVEEGELGRTMLDMMVRKLLSSAIAYIYGYEVRGTPLPPRLTPILIGPQMAGKTAWVSQLLPREAGDKAVLSGQDLDPNDKDSLQAVTRSLIVELGEVDTMLEKHHNSRLKRFLTTDELQLRLPYERAAEERKMATVFVGTSNDDMLFNDFTGNSRFFPVLVDHVDWPGFNALDLGKVWRQALQEYAAGMKEAAAGDVPLETLGNRLWWLSPDEKKLLSEDYLSWFAPPDITREAIEDCFDWNAPKKAWEWRRGQWAWNTCFPRSRSNDANRVPKSFFQTLRQFEGVEHRRIRVEGEEKERCKGGGNKRVKMWLLPPVRAQLSGTTGVVLGSEGEEENEFL